MQQTLTVRVVRLVDANKARAAFLAPLILALGSAVGSWIVTGEFNATEIRTAAGGGALALSAGVAAWLAKAREAEIKAPVVAEPGGPV